MRVLRSTAASEIPSPGAFPAFHHAGHAVAARLIETVSKGEPGVRPGARDVSFEDLLNYTAAGHAAERELACRSGLRWRQAASNAGSDLEACHRLIHDQTGEDHRDWIFLHWTRAVARATRLLAANWGEVVRLAELSARGRSGPYSLCSANTLRGAFCSKPDPWSSWWDDAIRRGRNDRPRSRLPAGGGAEGPRVAVSDPSGARQI